MGWARGRRSEGSAESVWDFGTSHYQWRRAYGGLKLDRAKRFKDLERDNERLKEAVSNLFSQQYSAPDSCVCGRDCTVKYLRGSFSLPIRKVGGSSFLCRIPKITKADTMLLRSKMRYHRSSAVQANLLSPIRIAAKFLNKLQNVFRPAIEACVLE